MRSTLRLPGDAAGLAVARDPDAGGWRGARRSGTLPGAEDPVMAKANPSPPKVRSCGAMQVLHRLLERDPGYRSRLARLEHATEMVLLAKAKPWKPVTIPVAVHVVWKAASENVSDAQIASQLVTLNRDFGAKNPDRSKVPAPWKGLVSDAGIRFELAKTTRTKTTRDAFGDDDSVKSAAKGGADPLPSSKLLNLWVCSLADGLLGYAQFPGGAAATDGVVVLNTAFGTKGTAAAPFDRGRTAVHEVGHWLNLRHIWGDTPDCSAGDSVADTPNAADANTGKPSFPHVTCGNGPHGDMFMNYMDYVDDAAMFLFTAGQVARMRAALRGPRKSFL
jgi:hypothetical protein